MKNFSQKIDFDIESFFDDCLSFIDKQNQNLVNYYTENGSFPKDAFDTLDSLVAKGHLLYKKVISARNNFNNYLDFLIWDQIEDFISLFSTMNNYSRWFKSSVIDGRFRKDTQVEYVLKQNQTLESLAREMGYLDGDEGAIKLASKNGIREIDYDTNGGLVFNLAYDDESGAVALESVVDEMSGTNLYGKDIQKKLTFADNDIVALSPKDTFAQACAIIIGLLKNSNPEFPNDGFDKDAISNRNIMQCRLATFIRQMYSVVQNDDTIANFKVINVSTDSDVLRIDMEFGSRLKENEKVTGSVYGN